MQELLLRLSIHGFSQQTRGSPAAGPEQLAKWAVLMLHNPQPVLLTFMYVHVTHNHAQITQLPCATS